MWSFVEKPGSSGIVPRSTRSCSPPARVGPSSFVSIDDERPRILTVLLAGVSEHVTPIGNGPRWVQDWEIEQTRRGVRPSLTEKLNGAPVFQ